MPLDPCLKGVWGWGRAFLMKRTSLAFHSKASDSHSRLYPKLSSLVLHILNFKLPQCGSFLALDGHMMPPATFYLCRSRNVEVWGQNLSGISGYHLRHGAETREGVELLGYPHTPGTLHSILSILLLGRGNQPGMQSAQTSNCCLQMWGIC
jgi:hypothetical protein